MPTEADLRRLVQNFAGEAKGLCEKASRELMALERPDGKEGAQRSRDNLARHLHTLKGSAATLGLTDVKEIAHRLETLSEATGDGAMPSDSVDLALRALDSALARVRAHASGGADALSSPQQLLETLDQAVGNLAGPPVMAEPEPPPSPPGRAAGAPRPAPAATGGRAQGQTQTQTQAQAPAEDGPAAEPVEEDDSWRVSHAHVAALSGVADRLRELRLRLSERRREVRGSLESMGLHPSALEMRALLERMEQALGAGSDDAEAVADGLDDALKSISTLPVSTILEPLQRTVRDAARTANKGATLSAVGGELMVDRRLLESLRGPLIHLVRNAVDHGLESPEVRDRAGKHRYGSVVIRAELRGNQLVVEVSDDGGGLDHRAIRATAVERGMMTAAEVEALSKETVEQLIFRSGFSTRKDASELSGRGVGLDVVYTQVRRLGGQVMVKSSPGQGTQFRLILPSRSGSAPVLPLGVGDVVVGFPVASVEAVSRVVPSEVHRTSGALLLDREGQLVPLQDLGGLLKVRHPVVLDEQLVVVARHLSTRFALVVDEVREHQDLPIRVLPDEVRSLTAYQGLAVQAGGALMPVLEPSWVAASVAGTALAMPGMGGSGRALVVDDSLTARALHRAILEASGYQVHLAASGPQALEHLRRAHYDVVVCDLAMAGMDGAAFTRAVRASQRSGVPVVVVSAHESEAHKQKALQAGADAFLTKRECVAGRLAAEVQAVIARRKGAA